jgi:tRNA (cmo5U34)-methyltransferase
MNEKDRLYLDESIQADNFVFDQRVVRVFPDMIRRSVPGYGVIVPSIALLARRYAQAGTNIYDLGCSLGAVTFAILDALPADEHTVIAIDNSPEMVTQFRRNAAKRRENRAAQEAPLQIVEADILDIEVENASVVIMNFTLQFIEPETREELMRRLAAGMRPGGLLLLSEKIRFANEPEENLQSAWHLDFKRAQGYSDLEIARKRDALEASLWPETVETHLGRLERAGFATAYRWFQCFNFAALAAFR